MLKTIGLAYRAKKVVYGTEMTLSSIRANKAKVVILAKDASKNTIKLFEDKCKFYKIDLLYIDDSKELSAAIGKTKIKVIAITDEGFKKLLKL